MKESTRQVTEIINRFEKGDYAYTEMEKIPVEDPNTLLELMKGLKSTNWRTTLACTRALGNSTVKPDVTVQTLIILLKNKKQMIREAAMESLGKLGRIAEKSVNHIVSLMKNEMEDLDMVRTGIVTLGKIGGNSSSAVSLLSKIIEEALKTDNDEKAVFNALSPYGKAGKSIFDIFLSKKDKQQPVSDSFNDEFGVIEDACTALGNFKDKSAKIIPLLIKTLAINNSKVRESAATAMVRLNDRHDLVIDEIIKLIINLGSDSDYSIQFEIRSLVELLKNFENRYPRIVFGLVYVENLPAVAYDNPSSILESFVTSRNFPQNHLKKLSEYLKHKSPNIRARAIDLLASREEESKFIIPRLLDMIDKEDDIVKMSIVKALGKLGTGNDDVLKKLKQLHEKETGSSELVDIIRDSLEKLGEQADTPQRGISPNKHLIKFIPVDFNFSFGGPLILQDKAFLAVHKILRNTGDREWKTNEDEFCVAALDPQNDFSLETYRLPLKFPVQATGGAGVKREFQLVTIFNEKLIFTLISPFSDKRGWGNDNYLYSFDPKTSQWERILKDMESGKLTFQPVLNEEQAEQNSNSIGFGESIVWVDENNHLQIIQDQTPYHLDDWIMDERVSKAFEQREKSKKKLIPHFLKSSVISDYLWVLDSRKYSSPEEVKANLPAFPVYDLKSWLLKNDSRLKKAGISNTIPLNAFQVEPGKEVYLLLTVRSFVDKKDDMIDSLLVFHIAQD